MTAPIKPQRPIEPQSWFAKHVREQLTPPPRNPAATLKALGLGTEYRPLHGLRRLAGGAVEGALNVPLDVAEFLTTEGGLADTPGLLDTALNPLQSATRSMAPSYRRATERIGRVVGGEWAGEPQSDPVAAGQLVGGLAPIPLAGQSKALDQLIRSIGRSAHGVLVPERSAVAARTAGPTFADEVAERLEARRVAPEDRELLQQLGSEQIDLSAYSREDLIRESAKVHNRLGELQGILGYDNPIELAHAQAYKRALDAELAHRTAVRPPAPLPIGNPLATRPVRR